MRAMALSTILLAITACRFPTDSDVDKQLPKTTLDVPRRILPKAPRPTFEQLAAARKAFAALGAKYEPIVNPRTKETMYRWIMPKTATDIDLQGIPNVPFGFALELHGPLVTPVGLRELKRLGNLTSLTLAQVRFADGDGREIDNLKHLRFLNELDFWGSYTHQLQGLRNLKHLNYFRTGLTDKVLRVMRENGQLHLLDQCHFEKGRGPVNDMDCTGLYLSRSPVTDAGLKEIKVLTNLRHIDVTHTKITSKGILQLRNLDLRTLNVTYPSRFWNSDRAEFLRAFPNIKIHKVYQAAR